MVTIAFLRQMPNASYNCWRWIFFYQCILQSFRDNIKSISTQKIWRRLKEPFFLQKVLKCALMQHYITELLENQILLIYLVFHLHIATHNRRCITLPYSIVTYDFSYNDFSYIYDECKSLNSYLHHNFLHQNNNN